jgi:membrane protein
MLRQGGEIPQPRRPQEWYEMPEETAPGVRWRSDGAGGAID